MALINAMVERLVRIWDPLTGAQRHQLDTGHPRGIRQVHVTPDGSWLATTGPTADPLGDGGDPVVRIWDPLTGAQRHQLDTGHPRGVERRYASPKTARL